MPKFSLLLNNRAGICPRPARPVSLLLPPALACGLNMGTGNQRQIPALPLCGLGSMTLHLWTSVSPAFSQNLSTSCSSGCLPLLSDFYPCPHQSCRPFLKKISSFIFHLPSTLPRSCTQTEKAGARRGKPEHCRMGIFSSITASKVLHVGHIE